MYKTENFLDRDFLIPEKDVESIGYFRGSDKQNIATSLQHVPENRRALVVQAGGNLGLFPIEYSKIFETVITFEPDPINFHCLAHNATEPNIVKIQAALGNDNKFISMDVPSPTHVGQNKVSKEQRGNIPTLKLDDFGLPALDLLQLDLEGYEYFALEGARKTIEKYKPTIVVEFANHWTHYGVPSDAIDNLLRDLGYVRKDRMHLDVVFTPIN